MSVLQRLTNLLIMVRHVSEVVVKKAKLRPHNQSVIYVFPSFRWKHYLLLQTKRKINQSDNE